MAQLVEGSRNQEIQGLKVVRVNQSDLLARVILAREAHLAAYAEASKGYWLLKQEQLERMLRDAKAERDSTDMEFLSKPENHVKDYDRVIAMLAMSLDTELTLPAHEFARYALDEWEWSAHFNNISSTYSIATKSRG